jgi:predicted metal-dependent hydrolase
MAKLNEPENKIEFFVSRSRRKTVALVVHQNNLVEVRCPVKFSNSRIESFVKDKYVWIKQKQQQNNLRIIVPQLQNINNEQLKVFKRQLQSRIDRILAGYEGPLPEKWLFRRQKSRWGSCSSKCQISINLHAVFLPDDLLKYLIMHELAHLVHMNHGIDFWSYLAKILPDAKEYRKKLNLYRLPDQ